MAAKHVTMVPGIFTVFVLPLNATDCENCELEKMMEDEEEDIQKGKTLPSVRITTKSQSSSVQVVQKTRIQSQIRSSYSTSTTNSIAEEESSVVPKCQIVTQQASGDSVDFEESEESISEDVLRSSLQQKLAGKYGLINKSPNSSSSQEDYEPEVKLLGRTTGQFLSAGGRVETARSMESLRSHHRSFLSSGDNLMRRSTEDIKLKRRAVSGEEMSLGVETESITAERRRGLFAGRDGGSVPQHLSLPPPANYLSLSPGDRRLTILSPHSPHHSHEMLHYSSSFSSIKMKRNKKSIVLPKLVLPRSDSEISEVFFDHGLE